MSQRDKLLILGAGGHGRVIADIAKSQGTYQKIAFLDDAESTTSFAGVEVIGPISDVMHYSEEYDVIAAIGDNSLRAGIQCGIEDIGVRFSALVHEKAVLGTSVTLGSGTVVMAGAILNCCSHVGRGCIINTAAVVDHDATIGNFVHVSPGACLCGSVTVGNGSWIGAGACVINNITICDNCVIGSGATVVRDITVPGTYVGTPARLLKP